MRATRRTATDRAATGTTATGTTATVAQVGSFQTAGFVAWVLWLAVHLVYLVGFKNRLTTLLHWTVSFPGRGRSERTATLQQVLARGALGEHERALGDQQPATDPERPADPAAPAGS